MRNNEAKTILKEFLDDSDKICQNKKNEKTPIRKAFDISYESICKIIAIEDRIKTLNGISDGKEFGASYENLQDTIEEIKEILCN